MQPRIGCLHILHLPPGEKNTHRLWPRAAIWTQEIKCRQLISIKWPRLVCRQSKKYTTTPTDRWSARQYNTSFFRCIWLLKCSSGNLNITVCQYSVLYKNSFSARIEIWLLKCRAWFLKEKYCMRCRWVLTRQFYW